MIEDYNKNDPNKRHFFRRKKTCPFSLPNSPKIDYKDVKLLTRYISEKGKIIPSRITNVSRKKQKELSKAIKRARFLSLMSYTNKIIRLRNFSKNPCEGDNRARLDVGLAVPFRSRSH